jgi:Ubiquitin-activating enzyme E1 FCCH domain/Lambda phage tail tube protein, TTP
MSSNAISAQGTTLQIATGTGGAKTITAISQGNPCIVTSTAHGLAKGDRVTFAGIVGMTQLNGVTASVEYITANTFALYGVDSSAYSAYTSGGTATPVTFTPVAEVVSFSGFDGQASEIDVSDLNSTAKEFKLGLVDSGGFSFTVNTLLSDAGQTAVRTSRDTSTSRQYKLTLPSGTPSVATFTAFAKQVPVAGGVDAKVQSNVALRITGPVTWA